MSWSRGKKRKNFKVGRQNLKWLIRGHVAAFDEIERSMIHLLTEEELEKFNSLSESLKSFNNLLKETK